MSQQEKLAYKDAPKPTQDVKLGDTSSDSTGDTARQNTQGYPKQYLRPSTPPNQMGSKLKDDNGNSPCSQACTSGTVTPNSEGVKRSDRDVFHAPPTGSVQ